MESHYYVYFFNGKYWAFDRTMPAEHYAKERVEELKKRYEDAQYTINKTLPGAFY